MVKKNMFEFHNEIHFRGKIFNIVQQKYYTDICLSCGNEYEPFRKRKNGQFVRDTVTVRFFKNEAKYYPEQFKIGDRVTIIGVVQTIVNKYSQRAKGIHIWGTNMLPAEDNMKDINDAALCGRIVSAAKISNQYIILNVRTTVTKRYKNTNENTQFPYLNKEYRSVTPVGIRVTATENADDLIFKKYTPGTWVSITGKIQGRKSAKDGKYSQRFIARDIEIIGETQKWNLKDRK